MLSSLGVPESCLICTSGREAAEHSWYGPVIWLTRILPAGMVFAGSLEAACRVVRGDDSTTDRRVVEYAEFMASPITRTEVMWAHLAAYPWRDLESMCANGIDPLDANTLRHVRRFVRRIFDGTEWRAVIRLGDNHLWQRELVFKRRHYFDVVTLLRTLDAVYGAAGLGRRGRSQRELFRRTVLAVLLELCGRGHSYERIYLTLFWLFTSEYWPTLTKVVLRMGSLRMCDADFVAIHKEVTAVVTQTWMIPFTNRQHPISSAFLNVENLIGWSDRDSLKGGVACEVLEFAVSKFHYVAGIRGLTHVPLDAGAEYLDRFKTGLTELLLPMYRDLGMLAKTWDDLLDERMAWMSGGAVGRRARDVLGPVSAPSGCSKAYAASRTPKDLFKPSWGPMYIEVGGKGNERGAERTLLATDLRDQIAESYALHMFKNKYGRIGIDIGESPIECMTRHLSIAAVSERDWDSTDERVLAAWDYSKWDHYVMQAERLIACDVMAELAKQYVRPTVLKEMLRELEIVRQGQESAIFRSRAYMVDDFRARADEAIRAAGGRARRVADDSVLLLEYAGQLSGRRSTLEGNTIISRGRLAVRDSELRAHERSEYLLNRADDVLEVYGKWVHARDAIDVMLQQGHKANPKKQVVQVRTGVYFRILYANGSMRGFPARAVYAAATGGPQVNGEFGVNMIERLRSLSSALDRLARRGSNYTICRALYSEAEGYYSDIRLELFPKEKDTGGTGIFVRHPVPKAQIRAAPENGGAGILPPGEYQYDMAVRVTPTESMHGRQWRAEIERLERKHHFIGLADLQNRAASMWSHDVGIEVPKEAWENWQRRWRASRAGQDGKLSILRARVRAAQWQLKARVHRDEKASPARNCWANWLIERCMSAFQTAWKHANWTPGGDAIGSVLSTIRGPTAEGMLDKLWWGLGQDVVSQQPDLLPKIAQSSSLGKVFMEEWSTLPEWIISLHLRGKLGPAGDWAKVIPSSWSPFIHEGVAVILFRTMGMGNVPTGPLVQPLPEPPNEHISSLINLLLQIELQPLNFSVTPDHIQD